VSRIDAGANTSLRHRINSAALRQGIANDEAAAAAVAGTVVGLTNFATVQCHVFRVSGSDFQNVDTDTVPVTSGDIDLGNIDTAGVVFASGVRVIQKFTSTDPAPWTIYGQIRISNTVTSWTGTTYSLGDDALSIADDSYALQIDNTLMGVGGSPAALGTSRVYVQASTAGGINLRTCDTSGIAEFRIWLMPFAASVPGGGGSGGGSFA